MPLKDRIISFSMPSNPAVFPKSNDPCTRSSLSEAQKRFSGNTEHSMAALLFKKRFPTTALICKKKSLVTANPRCRMLQRVWFPNPLASGDSRGTRPSEPHLAPQVGLLCRARLYYSYFYFAFYFRHPLHPRMPLPALFTAP